MRPPSRSTGWRSAACAAALFLCILEFAAFGGCTTQSPVILHDPVGPLQPNRTSTDTQGALIVYTATRVSTSDQSLYPVHTAYTICDQGGRIIRHVNNTAGLFGQDPAMVQLPAGEYRVKALAVDAGYVLVPVIIEPHKSTVVDLDGTVLPRNAGPSTGSDSGGGWVRLPNGHVVGSQAGCDRGSCK